MVFVCFCVEREAGTRTLPTAAVIDFGAPFFSTMRKLLSVSERLPLLSFRPPVWTMALLEEPVIGKEWRPRSQPWCRPGHLHATPGERLGCGSREGHLGLAEGRSDGDWA